MRTAVLPALLELAARYVAAAGPRRVRRAFLPVPTPDPAREAEFGLVELDDGSAGLYYAWLSPAQATLAGRGTDGSLLGRDALALARECARGDDATRSLAIALLNALTASFWRQSGFLPPTTNSSFGIEPAADARLGMIGNFPSLVRQWRASGRVLTVLERKDHMRADAPGLKITNDPGALASCTHVLCTASTLINGSFEETRALCPPEALLVVLGPTAGFFPWPLFAHGVAAVGGTLVTDVDRALARLQAGIRPGDAGYRYIVTAHDAPEFPALLARCAR
jgi:hypothetical protein